jgi:hypothetical protein
VVLSSGARALRLSSPPQSASLRPLHSTTIHHQSSLSTYPYSFECTHFIPLDNVESPQFKPLGTIEFPQCTPPNPVEISQVTPLNCVEFSQFTSHFRELTPFNSCEFHELETLFATHSATYNLHIAQTYSL